MANISGGCGATQFLKPIREMKWDWGVCRQGNWLGRLISVSQLCKEPVGLIQYLRIHRRAGQWPVLRAALTGCDLEPIPGPCQRPFSAWALLLTLALHSRVFPSMMSPLWAQRNWNLPPQACFFSRVKTLGLMFKMLFPSPSSPIQEMNIFPSISEIPIAFGYFFPPKLYWLSWHCLQLLI